jgi:hypothetical protein
MVEFSTVKLLLERVDREPTKANPEQDEAFMPGRGRQRFGGRDRVGLAFTLAAAAYNLARVPKLIAEVG